MAVAALTVAETGDEKVKRQSRKKFRCRPTKIAGVGKPTRICREHSTTEGSEELASPMDRSKLKPFSGSGPIWTIATMKERSSIIEPQETVEFESDSGSKREKHKDADEDCDGDGGNTEQHQENSENNGVDEDFIEDPTSAGESVRTTSQDVQSSMFDQVEPIYQNTKKKHTPGIIYLSYIPEGLTVAKAREILSVFGNVGRIYFEPIKRLDRKTRPNHRFAEGWVEFEKKRIAKMVAESLNAKPVGGKRRAPYHDALWSMKYLHRFRWPHLSERLAYEKAVKDQRLRTEIAHAKREASYYARALERSIRLRKKRKKEINQTANSGNDGSLLDAYANVRLKKTEREIRQAKNQSLQVDKKLLMSIFSK